MLKDLLKKSPPFWGGVWGGAIVLFLIGFFIARNSSDELATFKRTQILLGTVVEIQVRNNDEQKANNAITKAFTEIKRVDDLFTTYNEDSPVWKFNQKDSLIITVDDEIYSLMALCDSLWKISDGNFDAAIESLIRVWGFDNKHPDVPNGENLISALNESGWHNIKLSDDLKIHRTRIAALNFGGIAKGYAVDRAIEVLYNAGINEALVNAGGEVKSIGSNWIIGIQHPRKPNEIIKRIKLDGISVATSGDYENYFKKDGVRYHHILNPTNGYPARGLQSATVIHKDNAFADGLSTTVFVMGKTKGLELIESLDDTEAMIIDAEGKIFYSSGFNRFLISDN